MTGGDGNDEFLIAGAGNKTILDFDPEHDVIHFDDIKDIAALKTQAKLVDVDGVTSTQITYAVGQHDTGSLTIIGYNINTDTQLQEHFQL